MSSEIIRTSSGWLSSKALILLAAMLMLITATAPSRCHAQTWAEIFKQKKTQKKYLLQQIAVLQVYIGYAKKGYDIVGSGLNTVKDITNGEFRLHDLFISSLKQVNPVIRNDARVAEIILLQVGILKAFNDLKKSGYLSTENLSYVVLVGDGIIVDCFKDLEELLLVITSSKLEMKDDERLARLNQVYENMLDKSAFTQDFIGNARQLIQQRQMEQKGIEEMLRMFHHKE